MSLTVPTRIVSIDHTGPYQFHYHSLPLCAPNVSAAFPAALTSKASKPSKGRGFTKLPALSLHTQKHIHKRSSVFPTNIFTTKRFPEESITQLAEKKTYTFFASIHFNAPLWVTVDSLALKISIVFPLVFSQRHPRVSHFFLVQEHSAGFVKCQMDPRYG